jgi:hypothetical protein
MRENRLSGLTSGEWKRNARQPPQAPATERVGNGYGLSKHHRATPRLYISMERRVWAQGMHDFQGNHRFCRPSAPTGRVFQLALILNTAAMGLEAAADVVVMALERKLGVQFKACSPKS